MSSFWSNVKYRFYSRLDLQLSLSIEQSTAVDDRHQTTNTYHIFSPKIPLPTPELHIPCKIIITLKKINKFNV